MHIMKHFFHRTFHYPSPTGVADGDSADAVDAAVPVDHIILCDYAKHFQNIMWKKIVKVKMHFNSGD